MLAFSPAPLTFILTWASGISFLLLLYISFIPSYSPRRLWSEPLRGSFSISGHRSLYDGALFVGEDAHEVRQARDVEDLHVMLAQVAGEQALVRSARLGKQADDQGYPGRVDVVDPLEVEQDRLGVFGIGLGVGRVKGLFGEAVDLAHQVEHGNSRFQANLHTKMTHCHHFPPSAPRRTTSSIVWCPSSPVILISSTILFIRKSPHPRGVCMPSNFASRSGTSPPWDGGGPLPLSVMLTVRSRSTTSTRTSTGTSGLYLLPCSMAFIVASATAVLSRSRFSPRMSRPLTASATVSITNRSFPGSLGTENSARSSAFVRADLGSLMPSPISPG